MKKLSIWINVSRWIIVFAILLFPRPVFAQGEDPKTQADRLLTEALTLMDSAQLQAAMDKLEDAMALYRTANDKEGEAICLLFIGNIKEDLSDFSGSLEAYQASLNIFIAIDQRAWEGQVLINMGQVYLDIGSYELAMENYKAALQIQREVASRQGEAIAIKGIGKVYHALGQYESALDYYEQALAIHREIGDERGEATTLSNMGLVYHHMGQYDRALSLYHEALPITEKLDRAQDGILRNNIGLALNEIGDYHEALQYFQQALDIHREIGDRAEEATTLSNFGLIYANMGQDDQALKYFQEALAIQQEIGDRPKEEFTLGNIGMLHFQRHELELAEEYFTDQLAIDEDLGQQEGIGAVLNYLGLIYNERGQYQQALETYQQALAIRQAINDRSGEAFTLSNIGFTYERLGQHALALEHYQRALLIQQEIGDPVGESNTLGKLAGLHSQGGDTSQAIAQYQQAIELIESIQEGIKVEEFKASFVNNNVVSYEALIALLWNEDRFEEAFHYAERARARAFLDQLATGTLNFRTGADADLLEREQALQEEVKALRSRLATLRVQPSTEENNLAMAEITKSLAEREAEYTQLLTEMKLQHPEVASLVSVDADALTLANIQSLLDPQTTLVEYFVTDDRILIFVITNKSFETTAVDIPYKQLLPAIGALYPFAELNDPYPSGLQQLYTWLISPVKEKLNTQVVGIVPHNVLHYIPFSALTDGESYLIDDYTLFSLPSASTLRFVQEKREPTISNVLVLGDPTTDLPGLNSAAEEATKIAGLYGAEPFLRDAASESVLVAQASDADVLHLAAHGSYNTSNPLFSVIRLASDSQNDGRLEAYEVYALDLTTTTDLVVLSACQTSLGELEEDVVSKGDEIVGLNRAFLYAGTPTVVASLWNVNDASTAQLMENFYSHLKSGRSKGDALRQAQIEVRSQYPHPYYWAAFVLTGDPGESVVVPGTSANEAWPAWLSVAGLLGLCCFGAALLITAGVILNRSRKKIRT